MNIKGPLEFANWISSSNLTHRDSIFTQIVNCANNFRSACNCYKKEDKLRLFNNCTKLYNNAIINVIPKLKEEILSKIPERQISFYNEQGKLIRIVSH